MIAEFFRDKPLNHLIMLAAIVLQFVSYFFQYGDGSDGGSQIVLAPNFSGSTVFPGFGGPADGNGWENNPQGWVILVVLAFAFLRSDIYDHPLMQKWGWWLGLLLVAGCNVFSDGVRTFGSSLGLIAVLIALAAAILHQMARKKAPATKP